MGHCGWEHFEHKADIGVRGFGSTPEEAFAQAALALTAVVTDPSRVEARDVVEVELERDDDGDLELLLVDFLNALIYEMAVRKMLFSRYQLRLDDRRLRICMWGEPVDSHRHEPAVEVKGATYTELKVAEVEPGRWLAQCVLDV